MQNWGTVINASNTALNSQNSAINENAKYQESLQAKINRLNTAWKELSLAMGNAVVTNGFIDLVNGLKDLATVATPVVKTVGVLPIVLGSAGFAAVTFSSKIREMVLGLTITKTAMQALSVESVALKGAIASTGIGLLFIGIGFALEKIIGYYGQVNAEHEKEQQQLDQSLRGYQENTKQVSAWVEEYSKLDKLKNNGGLDNTQQQQYLDIQQKLANVLPTVVAGTDAQGRSVLVSSDALKANIELLKQKIKLEHDSAVISAPQDIQNSNNNINSFRDQIKQKEDDIKQLNEAIKQSNELINNPKTSSFTRNSNLALVSQWTKDLNNDQKDILGLQIKINDEYSKQEVKVKNILSVYKSLSSGDVNWLAKLVTDGKVSVDQIENLGKTIQSVRENLGKSLPSNFFSNMTADQIKSITNLSDEYKKGQISFVQYSNALQHSGISLSKVSTLIDGMTTSSDKSKKATLSLADAQLTLQDILDGNKKAEDVLMQATLGYTQADIDQKQKLINIYNTLSQVQVKDEAQKQLLAATIQQLTELFPGLVNGHNVNIKAMMNEVDAQSILAQAVTKAANGQLSAEQITTLGKVQATNKRIDAMKNEIRALETLQSAYNRAAQTVENMLTSADASMALASGDVAKWTTIAMQTRNLMSSVGGGNLGGLVSEMNSLESSNNSNLNKLGKSIGYTPPYQTPSFPSGGSSGSGSHKSKKGKSGSGSGSSSQPVAEYQTDKYQQQLDALDTKIKEVDASTQKLDHTSKGYIDGLKEEISLTKQKEAVVNSEISSLEKRDKAIQKQLKSMGSFNHLSNAQKQTYNQLAQELDQNTQKINQLKDANIGFANDMANIQGQITQVYSDLADQVVQIEKDAYEKERQIALDANKKKMDDLDAEHNKIMQNYDEMSKYQDVIDQKTKALDKASSDRSYNESLSAKQKAAQDTLNQINVMKLDTSAEGQAKLADLQKQYAQEEQDLQDTQYQHGVDLQKQNLQDQATSYQKDIDAKKKAEDDKYNATKTELQKEQDAINKYYDNIANDDRKWAKLHQDIMNGHFDQVKKDFKNFTDILKGHMDELGKSITQNLLDTLDQASKEMAALTGASTPSSSGGKKSSSGGSKSSSGSSHKSSGSSHHDSSSSSHKSNRYYTVRKGDTLSDIAEKYYGHGTPYYYDKIANANHISNPDRIYPGERLLIPYDTGGYTGTFDGGRIALLHQKELVLNKDDTTNMLKMVNIVRDLIPKINFPDLSNLAGKLGNTIHMPITIQNLNGGKEGATEFFNIIGNHMKIMGVNN